MQLRVQQWARELVFLRGTYDLFMWRRSTSASVAARVQNMPAMRRGRIKASKALHRANA